jgi:hypothetical protein
MRKIFILVTVLFFTVLPFAFHSTISAQQKPEVIELETVDPLPQPVSLGITDILGGDTLRLSALIEKHGIWQCVLLVTILFIIRYVGNVQNANKDRENFMQSQLERRDCKMNDEMSQMLVSLRDADSKLKTVATQMSNHQDMIRMNGQLCHEIITVMAQHNAIVEQNLRAITQKLEEIKPETKKKKTA